MTDNKSVNASALIDSEPISRAQIIIFILAFFVSTLDGLDTQVIGYVSLEIAREWGISRASLGSVLSIGLFGIMIGSLTLGMLGDMIGQRRILIVLTALVGGLTIATGFTETSGQLMVIRFLTGICVGGTLPNTAALISQYAPTRRRAGFISIVGIGFPLGAALGGVMAALFLPEPGWRTVFHASGSLALIFVPLLVWLLPDPIPALLKQKNGHPDALTQLRRLFPQVAADATVVWDVADKQYSKVPIAALFKEGRTPLTLLLWAVFIMSLLNVYLLPNWLPALLQDAKMPVKQAVIATSGLSIAGMFGAMCIGYCIDRLGIARTLCCTYFIGGLVIALLALTRMPFEAMVATVFVSGFFLIGSQSGLNAVPSLLYPSEVRSTATGWGLGIGRVGSIGGPLIAGIMLDRGATYVDVLLVCTGTATLAAIFIFAVSIAQKQLSKSN